MNDLTLIVAFAAGLVSFLSPCVLPIVPGFLAYLAGSSQEKPSRRDVFLNSLFFVLGFSVVFALLGVLLNSLLEGIAYDVQLWMSRIGGAIIIFFGLFLVGLIKIPWLERTHSIQIKQRFKSKYVTSFLFGLAFAAGWTPCVGAALGAILGLAATQPGIAFSLLLSYALGLGIPFLIIGMFTGKIQQIITRSAKAFKVINIIFGLVLIVLGMLIFTQNLNLIANLEFVNKIIQR